MNRHNRIDLVALLLLGIKTPMKPQSPASDPNPVSFEVVSA